MKKIKLTMVTAVVLALTCSVSFSASSIDWSEANEEGLAQFIYEVIEADQSEMENSQATEAMYSILHERSSMDMLRTGDHYVANNDPAAALASQETVLTSEALQLALPEMDSAKSFVAQSVQLEGSVIEVANVEQPMTNDWSAIPEPATALFGIVGIAALVVARNRRKARD